MSILLSLTSMICVLISVAFFTILERKILGYIQIRKGPNKVGIVGILQPFSDAVKLFNKTILSNEMTNFFILFSAPSFSLFLSLIILPLISFSNFSSFDNKQNILLFFIISSLSVYSILMIGWSSNSKYGHLGAIRSVAQMISYEVSFFLIILFLCFMSNSFNFTQFMESQYFMPFFWGNSFLFLMWFVSCLAEVNRSPFDFAESESELVSGFNVEYMGGLFALIFLAEYSNMIILSLISVILFFPSVKTSFLILVIISLTMLWVRGSFPRFRYDFLMMFNWTILLPMILLMLPFTTLLSLFSS